METLFTQFSSFNAILLDSLSSYFIRNYSLGLNVCIHLKKLQLLQNKAVRAICSLNWREHVTPCFDRLSILQVRDVAKMEMAKFVHKSVNHSSPKYFQTYFHKVSLDTNVLLGLPLVII